MATGDLYNNLERLRLELRVLRYDGPFDTRALAAGEPAAFLPLLHHAFLGHSAHVAQWLGARGYELYSKSDMRFVELVFRIARAEFGYRHTLTPAQMLTAGFAERKALFAVDMLRATAAKADGLARDAGLPASAGGRAGAGGTRARAPGLDSARAAKASPRHGRADENAPAPPARAGGALAAEQPQRAQPQRAQPQEPREQARPLGAACRNPAAAHASADLKAGAAGARHVGARCGHAEARPPPQPVLPEPAEAQGAALHALESRLAVALDGISARLDGRLSQVCARLGLLERRVARLEGSAPGGSDQQLRWAEAAREGPGSAVLRWVDEPLGRAACAGASAEPPPQPLLEDVPAPPSRAAEREGRPLGPREWRAEPPAPPADFELFDPAHRASASDFLRHLEARFEATEALVTQTLHSTAGLAQPHAAARLA